MDEEDISISRRSQAFLEFFYAAGDHAALRRYSDDETVAPEVRAYAAGLLFRPWLPWGAWRKALMFLLTMGVVTLSFTIASLLPLFLLVIPVSFSPRIMGETLTLIALLRHGGKLRSDAEEPPDAASIAEIRSDAEEGNAEAQGMLGSLYYYGRGVAQDYSMAYIWYNLAAEQGDEEAEKALDAVAGELDTASLAEAQKLSKEYFKRYVEPFQ